MKVLTRLVEYNPRLVGDDKIKVYLLERREFEWREESHRRSKHQLDRLLAYAANMVTLHPPRDNYVFGEAEIPGLRAFFGEGRFPEAETVILPKPAPVTSIKLYRLEDGKPILVHEYKPPSELWGYETRITVDPSLQYDLIVVETPEGPRPILRHETRLPAHTASTSGRKRRVKRRGRKRRVKKSRRRK
jgi:hypothetical protein